MEESERTNESKTILSLIIPNHKVHTWTRPVTKIHKMLDLFCFSGVGIHYFFCNQADKDNCVGHGFSFKVYGMNSIVYPTFAHTLLL